MAAGRRPPVDLSIDQRSLRAVVRALDAEADGKKLKRDLQKQLREAVKPAIPLLQDAVRQLPSEDPPSSPDLRDTVARQIKVQARTAGKNPGAKIRVGTAQDPRGFRFAGRRLNKIKGWRHPVFGNTEVWVQQYGRQGVRWFEPTILRDAAKYRAAAKRAVDDMARRIASQTTRGKR